jgi:hypothetical protein
MAVALCFGSVRTAVLANAVPRRLQPRAATSQLKSGAGRSGDIGAGDERLTPAGWSPALGSNGSGPVQLQEMFMSPYRPLVLATTIALMAWSPLTEAQPAGQAGIIPNGEAAPDHPQPFVPSVVRSDVRADARRAARSGLIAAGEAALSKQPEFVAAKSRAEVKAETRMAMHLGLIPVGEGPGRTPTPSEDELIRLAGLHARTSAVASR